MFQTARNLCTPVPFLSSYNSHFFFCLFGLFLSSFHFFFFSPFPLSSFFLFFLSSYIQFPFFSFFSLLLCFHFHSVPTNSPYSCAVRYPGYSTRAAFFMLAVRAALTAKFSKCQDDILLFASQLASFPICSPRVIRSAFSLFLRRFATPFIGWNTSAGTICRLPLRSNSCKQQTVSSSSENHVREPTFLRNSLSPRLTTPDTSTDRETGCERDRTRKRKKKKGEKTEGDKKLS